jgi:hypothetical protein
VGDTIEYLASVLREQRRDHWREVLRADAVITTISPGYGIGL